MNFQHQTVIVTGAANGIGACVASSYAKEGARVVLADIDEEKGKRLEEQLRNKSYEAYFKKTDVKQNGTFKACWRLPNSVLIRLTF